MKYIDAEPLRVEIEKHIKEVKDAALKFKRNFGFFDAKLSGFYDVMAIIDSLQQEQPEVDFEKELKNEKVKLLDAFGPMNGEQSLAIKNFASHFIEVGLKARKEE